MAKPEQRQQQAIILSKAWHSMFNNMGLTHLQAAREVDDARHEASKTEAEVAGLRAALDSARARHFEQLTK